jgi:hypothetical protein
MENKLFMDPACKPAEASLELALGRVYPSYKNLLILTGKLLQDWNFSKSGGWMLKVLANKKALFYLIPMKNEFKISMAIRENERVLLITDPDLQTSHPLIVGAKKHNEGYALQIIIANEDGFQKVKIFLNQFDRPDPPPPEFAAFLYQRISKPM